MAHSRADRVSGVLGAHVWLLSRMPCRGKGGETGCLINSVKCEEGKVYFYCNLGWLERVLVKLEGNMIYVYMIYLNMIYPYACVWYVCLVSCSTSDQKLEGVKVKGLL